MFGDYNTNLEEVTSSPFNTSYPQHLENEEDSADSDEEIQTGKEDDQKLVMKKESRCKTTPKKKGCRIADLKAHSVVWKYDSATILVIIFWNFTIC